MSRARRAISAGLWVAFVAGALVPTAALADRPPAESYLLHCSGCHGGDGRGIPGTTPGLYDLAALVDAEGGREYLVRVPGVAQAPVDDAALAGLLNWVLSEFSGRRLAEPYSSTEVAAIRRRPLRDPAAHRAEIVTQAQSRADSRE